LNQALTKFEFTTSATFGSENVTVLRMSAAAQHPPFSRLPTSWWNRIGFPSALARCFAASSEFSQMTLDSSRLTGRLGPLLDGGAPAPGTMAPDAPISPRGTPEPSDVATVSKVFRVDPFGRSRNLGILAGKSSAETPGRSSPTKGADTRRPKDMASAIFIFMHHLNDFRLVRRMISKKVQYNFPGRPEQNTVCMTLEAGAGLPLRSVALLHPGDGHLKHLGRNVEDVFIERSAHGGPDPCRKTSGVRSLGRLPGGIFP